MKLHERIDLRLSTETYNALLIEAGGNSRDVPDLIRTKLDEAIRGKTHAHETRAALKFIVEMLKRLYIDDAPVLARILGMVDGYTEEKKREESTRLTRIKVDRHEVVEKLKMESRLSRF